MTSPSHGATGPSRFLAAAVLMVVVLAMPGTLLAQSVPDTSRIQLEVWTETTPLQDGLPGPELSQAKLDSILATEARNLFSGMIHGYTFTYRPSDIARGVEELFEFRPRGIIQSTATVSEKGYGLMALQSWTKDNMARAILAYQCTPAEHAALSRWRMAEIPDAAGTGGQDYRSGPEDRTKAFAMACKEAVRAYGRALTRNKPDRITGRFALAAAPRFRIDNGTWYADVRIRLIVEDLDAWRTW